MNKLTEPNELEQTIPDGFAINVTIEITEQNKDALYKIIQEGIKQGKIII